MMTNRTFLSLLSMLLLAAMATGCSRAPRMGQYTYRVALDEALRDTNTGVMPSIEVDLVGVNETERSRWESVDIDDYFAPGNVLRANADRFTMAFTNENAQPQLLPGDHAIWEKWKRAGAVNMFILASVPISSDQFAIDPRRLVLPLDQARWTSSLIDILVKPSGVVCQTPMRPLKQ